METTVTRTDRSPLTEEYIRFFRENGYVAVPDVLSPDELAQVRAAVDDAYARRFDADHDGIGRDARYDAVFQQKVNLWQVHEGIRAYAFSRKVAEMARRLLGVDAVRLWHDQTLVKQPNVAKATPFHQDLSYWPIEEDLAITAWTALDDVDERNSCMMYVPRSHAWGRLPGNNFVDPRDVADLAPGHEDECVSVSVACRAGSVVFHHGLTFHGATPNVTDRPRRAMIMHYMADGVHYSGQKHIVTDPTGLPVGAPLTDDALWPLLAEG